MNKLRPECKTDSRKTAMNDRSALLAIYKAVSKRRGLISGQLDDDNGRHCAMGCFWQDNPFQAVNETLLNEVAAVNDSVPSHATRKARWLTVRRWLLKRMESLGMTP